MEIRENISLGSFNTFGVDVKTRWMFLLSDEADVAEMLKHPEFRFKRRLLLGEGSNVLFSGDFDGVVVRPLMHEVELVRKEMDSVWVKAGAGKNWDAFVQEMVQRGYGGLENLSYIPGTVGAAPVQNIGAYGAEVKDSIAEVHGIDLDTGKKIVLNRPKCNFRYRSSIFKEEFSDTFLITAVVFRLSLNPALNLTYAMVKEALSAYDKAGISEVREAIIAIRKQKLPETSELGNCGSFFKNPEVDTELAQALAVKWPGIPLYPVGNDITKLSAAWLIDQCGWKGKRIAAAGVYEKQPLVLVNHGGAQPADILQLKNEIQLSVLDKFNVLLEPEVKIVE